MSASALQTYFTDVLQLQHRHQQLIESQQSCCFVIVSDQHRSHAKHEKRRRDDLLPNGTGGLVRQHSEQRWKVCEDSHSTCGHLRSSPSMEMIRKTAASKRRRPVSSANPSTSTVVSSNSTAVRWCPTDSAPITTTRSGRGRGTTMTTTATTRRSEGSDLLQGGSGLKIPQRCESPPPTCRSRSPSISPSELHQFRRYNSSSPLYSQQKTETMCLTTTSFSSSSSLSPATNSSSWVLSLSPECSPSSSSSSSSRSVTRLGSFLKGEDEEKLRYHEALNVASAHCSCASPLGKTNTERRHVFPHAAWEREKIKNKNQNQNETKQETKTKLFYSYRNIKG